MNFPSAVVFVQQGCPACHEFLPRFARASIPFRARGGKVHVVDINASKQAAAQADKFKVRATPTTVVFSPQGFRKIEGAAAEADVARLLASV
jgi:thioredoxin-like negative regulator of GroEL